MAVTIDARILYGPTTGTHVHVVELIASLARTERLHLSVIVPDQPSEDALERLRTLPGLRLATYAEASGGADVVHRPFQLSNAGDLTFLEALGERLLLTQQDLIAFHNPAYFPTAAAWHDYRDLTRLALDTADRVLFFSAHARNDALGEDLVDPARASVVHLGVDHPETSTEPMPPAGAGRIADGPLLLCLGTDFLHKNRVFALRLLGALRERRVEAMLAFAGATVAHGSSRLEEQRFLQSHPHLAAAVLDLGAVTEAEKHWLYRRATLVVYPTVVEGFGLVPFEAGAHRVPCLWAPGSSLSELLPGEAAGIVPWDAEQSAEHARAFLEDQQARERNVNAIETAAQSLTWDATAHQLIDVYRAAADAPARPRTADTGLTLTEDAARLVGPGGELPADVHRPLLALATHPRLAKPAYAALKLGYRLLQRRR
jgi:glycosyltransferase involved in cell wall biosynthesis